MSKKKKDWLTFDQARTVLHDEDIGSRNQFLRWHDLHKPAGISKYPNRVYIKEWAGWNDFLGNNNTVDMAPKKYRSYEQAMALLHPMGITSTLEYREMMRGGKLPEDLPSNPQLVYDKWVTWSHYLGNKVVKRLEAAKVVKQAELDLLIIASYKGRPGGVYGVFVIRGGEAQLKDMMESASFVVMRKFKLDEGYDWRTVIAQHGKQWNDWQARNNEYLIPNVNQMIFDLSCDLLFA